ncbi:MAG: 4-oxalocrotonate tautomerase [Desulfobulbaceae bacterium DB1]|nr:MAG: 4-oxalocrotonate tautomerase [Desulfobulbaceae bacterium DB1]
MPYVNIRVAGILSREQKEDICAGVTDVISRVAGKPKESILIFIDEVAHENIASGGNMLKKPAATK